MYIYKNTNVKRREGPVPPSNPPPGSVSDVISLTSYGDFEKDLLCNNSILRISYMLWLSSGVHTTGKMENINAHRYAHHGIKMGTVDNCKLNIKYGLVEGQANWSYWLVTEKSSGQTPLLGQPMKIQASKSYLQRACCFSSFWTLRSTVLKRNNSVLIFFCQGRRTPSPGVAHLGSPLPLSLSLSAEPFVPTTRATRLM